MKQETKTILLILKVLSATCFDTKLKLLHLYSSPSTSIDDTFFKLLYITFDPEIKYKIKSIINLSNIRYLSTIRSNKKSKTTLDESLDLFIKLIQARNKKININNIKNFIKVLSIEYKMIFFCVFKNDLNLKLHKRHIKKIIKNRKIKKIIKNRKINT